MQQKFNRDEYAEYAKTHTKLELMEHFDISATTVDVMKQKFGVYYQPRNVPPTVRSKDMNLEDFVSFCKEHSMRDIEKKFEVTPSTIYQWERKYKFKIKPSVNPIEQVERNTEIYNLCKTQSQYSVAKQYGITKQRVNAICRACERKESKNGNN